VKSTRVLLVVLLASAGVRAEEPPEKAKARALLVEGNSRFAAGDFVTALDRFKRAFDAFPSAKLLMNVAACERKLGRNERAANDLEEYLRRYAQLTAPVEMEDKLAQLARAELDEWRPMLGRIATTRPPLDATLEVDEEAGSLARWVQPGPHHVVLRAPNRETLDRTVNVGRGDTATVDLPEPAIRVEPVAAVVLEAPVTTAPPPPRRRAWGAARGHRGRRGRGRARARAGARPRARSLVGVPPDEREHLVLAVRWVLL
jgi:hypothetical protein